MALYHKSHSEIDQELKIIKAAQKDPAKFSTLYERYYAPIRGFILRRVSDEDVASDITSQVFLKALHNLPRYKFKGVPFAAFLYRIASNEVNLNFRKKKQAPDLHIPMDKVLTLIDTDDNEWQETQDHHLLLLKKAFEKLNDQEVEMIEMFYFQELSFREIGAYWNITENNAKVKTKRIRDKLKKFIEEELKHTNE